MTIKNNRSRSAVFFYKSNGKTLKLRLKPFESTRVNALTDLNNVLSRDFITNFESTVPTAVTGSTFVTVTTTGTKAVDNRDAMPTSKETKGNFEISY
jgi:hypothetical protein